MHLPSGLHLIISSLLFSTSIAAAAIPDASSSLVAARDSTKLHTYSSSSPSGIELDPSTFSETIKEGLWFIEHFSPYCGHCKHFKPTWQQLVLDTRAKGEDGLGGGEVPEVGMGVVDCTLHGDLCDANKVTGYPTLLMFHDGKIVDQFKKARELEDLKAFMKRHVKAAAPPPPPPPPPVAPVQPPAAEAVKQPPAVTLNPNINPNGEVLSLTPSSFTSIMATGPTFVKFFAPWCGHCKKLAPTWKQLARHMKGRVNIVEVNCDDHTSLCKQEGVQGYPTLMWYANRGAKGYEYNSGRKIDQLKAFTDKASSAGVQVLAESADLDKHIAEEEVLYLLLHSPTDTEILRVIRGASSVLLGSPQIFASSDPALHTRYSIPAGSPWALVALKDHDAKTPSSIHYGSSPSSLYTSSSSDESKKLNRWLLTHRLPTTTELTRDTFQSVMNAPQSPLVVLCFSPERTQDAVMRRLKDIGAKWRHRTEGSGIVHGKEVVFAWMDEDKWTDWMKSMYGLAKRPEIEGQGDLDTVRVVIADHSKLVYYNTDHAGNAIRFTSSSSMFAAVDDAASGKSKAHNSEGTIERMARYLNNKMQSLESFVIEKPFHSLFILIAFFALAFVVITRLVNSDVSSAQNEWKELKGRSGRLD
ncbi:Thioredoxin domain-containing protein 5 [Psilocybe cubensis]|uniref:Thioredoxin domain-containing protein 5 n=1 Tax=Psilocybe cubensis TaxID=181762 RepID=A0ACB8H587_PSICU|nr:Thioredoxin domain-containing protein 5 [Psilocybe cubensis]KAH9483160.1 Thioredoxin domain-containing protein 5 [Psilocybe cubensis]